MMRRCGASGRLRTPLLLAFTVAACAPRGSRGRGGPAPDGGVPAIDGGGVGAAVAPPPPPIPSAERTVYKLPALGRQANVAQILIADSSGRAPWLSAAARKRSPAEAKALARRLYEELHRGGDFAALAKTYSDWPLGARSGGALGIVTEGQPEQVPNFDATVFGLAVGEVAEPLVGPLGQYLFKRLPLVRVAHIALRYGAEAPGARSRETALALADQIGRELRSGSAFADEAFAHSDDPSTAGRGGDLGSFDPQRLPAGLSKGLQGLSPKAVSAPIDAGATIEIFERLE